MQMILLTANKHNFLNLRVLYSGPINFSSFILILSNLKTVQMLSRISKKNHDRAEKLSPFLSHFHGHHLPLRLAGRIQALSGIKPVHRVNSNLRVATHWEWERSRHADAGPSVNFFWWINYTAVGVSSSTKTNWKHVTPRWKNWALLHISSRNCNSTHSQHPALFRGTQWQCSKGGGSICTLICPDLRLRIQGFRHIFQM